jgi:hypothetical protein
MMRDDFFFFSFDRLTAGAFFNQQPTHILLYNSRQLPPTLPHRPTRWRIRWPSRSSASRFRRGSLGQSTNLGCACMYIYIFFDKFIPDHQHLTPLVYVLSNARSRFDIRYARNYHSLMTPRFFPNQYRHPCSHAPATATAPRLMAKPSVLPVPLPHADADVILIRLDPMPGAATLDLADAVAAVLADAAVGMSAVEVRVNFFFFMHNAVGKKKFDTVHFFVFWHTCR